MIGAGGHAKVVIEALIANGHHFGQIIARDGNSARQGQRIGEVWIAHPEIEPAMAGDKAHVAIGSGDVRAKLYARALAIGCHALTIIHPAAHVSPSAVIGAGSFIAAGAIVAASAVVGTGCIINHGAVVDHDCVIGAHSHVAPNATLGGGVTLGENVMIGAGAVILPGLSVGANSLIGAGAVLTRSIGAKQIWFGNPAVEQA